MAGLNPVQLIKEPEAAALWTTKKLKVALHSGDVFVVYDAGGGGMAGSLYLNKRFECAVKDLAGEGAVERVTLKQRLPACINAV
ncbi:hypothetical protein GGI35DRAFT_485091 [Trichoderma velutinum]